MVAKTKVAEDKKNDIRLYRALSPLDMGKGRVCRKNDVFLNIRLDKAAVEKLEKMKKIAPVQTPPLAILPDWRVRAKDLDKKVGIRTVEELLNSDPEIVAEVMNQPVRKIKGWQIEVLSLFVVEDDQKKCWERR